MENYTEVGNCSICGNQYKRYGNNALPINDGRCCDKCNNDIVIPERIKRMIQGKSIYEKE